MADQTENNRSAAETPGGAAIAIVRHSAHTAGSFKRDVQLTATEAEVANKPAYAQSSSLACVYSTQPASQPVTMETVFRSHYHDNGSHDAACDVVTSLRSGVVLDNGGCVFLNTVQTNCFRSVLDIVGTHAQR